VPAHDNTACDSQSAHQHNTALTISAPASIYMKFSRHVSLQIRKQLIKTLVKYVVLEVAGRAKTQFQCKYEISHHKTNWSLYSCFLYSSKSNCSSKAKFNFYSALGRNFRINCFHQQQQET